MLRRRQENAAPSPLSRFERLELADQPFNHGETDLPEAGVAGIEAEGCQQFRMMFGAAGREHGEIALGKTLLRLLIDAIERVHQAIAERIGVNIEGRMNEVRNIGPVAL